MGGRAERRSGVRGDETVVSDGEYCKRARDLDGLGLHFNGT